MPHCGGFCPEMRCWAELGPKTINIPCAMEGFPPGPEKCAFLQKSQISWNFMKSHKISRNFRKGAPPGRPKMKRLIWRYTCVHSGWWILPQKVQIFMIFMEKVEFSWISWNFIIFTKTALFAPKCTLGHLGSQNHQYSLCYGRISASGRKCALFREKLHFLLFFTLFAKITFFMIFMIFMKNMNFRIMQDKQGRKSAKRCIFIIFMKISWKSQKIREFSEFPGIMIK